MSTDGEGPVKRRHHVVPNFYLRRFADEKRMITRVPLGGGEVRTIPTKDATVQTDFYRLEHPELRPDALEDALAGIEADIAPALTRVVDQGAWPPSDEDRFWLATFVALQYLRSQSTRSGIEEITRSIGKLELGVMSTDQVREMLGLSDDASDAQVEELRANALVTADTFAVDRHAHLRYLLDGLEGTTNLVMGRGPWALILWERKVLGTSDSPVICVSDETTGFYSNAGFGMARELIVPVGRRACLVLGKVGGEGEDQRLAGNSARARLINDYTLRNARREAFHHPDDQPFAGREVPKRRDREIQVSGSHIDTLIRDFARMQGRPSGLPGEESSE
ncbi:DUF4238 domain-containing protein [Nakamurella flava]|nr:DUF4238 domain-containing protein [Nakamurella flava]